MAKILQITDEIVTIGMDDGSITEVRPCDLTFTPAVNDDVQVFQNETRTMVSKIEKTSESIAEANTSGINININNSNELNNSLPSSVNGKKAVNKLAYCLLTLFLGGFGAHKFYSGKIVLGILYLLFCWTYVPAFVALIELIIALFKKADANGKILV